ncbi:tRNA intron endonuclease [Nitzschia inconspicua]|uniref:tRNA intron endonuclease n=1 Tax=Nitzschia inconspicua TaxID=303405 RepID=A0A9K3LHT9_9STRA|nr:tRNA intron endonuclease [Nitzschia inconspicua]
MEKEGVKSAFVRRHYESLGYRVHSGLQFGCDFVLYADSPEAVHSDFCVYIIGNDGFIDWREIQTLTRSMPDFHKTLIVVQVKGEYIKELAMGTEHAPFRNRPVPKAVGSQVKPHKKAKLEEKQSK